MTTNVDQIGRWKMCDSKTGKEIMVLGNLKRIHSDYFEKG